MADALLLALVRLIGGLSFRFAGSLGAGVGHLLYWLKGREVRNARVNLARCFPGLPSRDRERLVRQNLVHTGRYLTQMLRLWVGRPLPLDDLVDQNGFLEAAAELLQRGNGLIVAMPHMGNWELIAYWATRAAPATALYRPARITALDGLIRAGRTRSGLTPVPIDRHGLKALHGALQRNEIVGILPDQVPKTAGASGVVAPFFGHPAMTMTLVGRLVRRHATPVLFCCAIHDRQTGRHRFHHFVGDPAIGDASAEVAATALNAAIERFAREFPEHYQWTYRRFEIPGSDQPNPYSDD